MRLNKWTSTFLLTALLTLMIGGDSAAVMVSYSCKFSDVKGTTSAPCVCTLTNLSPPFCPRLEGIQLPCLQEVSLGSCTYDDGTPELPKCVEWGKCEGTRRVCSEEGTCQGTRQECAGWVSETCTRQVQGECNNYSEGGICLGYSYTTETYSCERCSGYQSVPYDYSCCKNYKDEPYEYDCCTKEE